jgi:hypothetical protein
MGLYGNLATVRFGVMVNNVFYAYEDLVAAAAAARNIRWAENHYKKAGLAQKLFTHGNRGLHSVQ